MDYEKRKVTEHIMFSVKGTKGACDRKVPIQPLYFLGEDKKITRYNLRKLNETPYHLIRSNRFDELYKEVLFNFRWLHAKINCMPLQVGKRFSTCIIVLLAMILPRTHVINIITNKQHHNTHND